MQGLIDDGKIRGWGLCNDNAYGLTGCTCTSRVLSITPRAHSRETSCSSIASLRRGTFWRLHCPPTRMWALWPTRPSRGGRCSRGKPLTGQQHWTARSATWQLGQWGTPKAGRTSLAGPGRSNNTAQSWRRRQLGNTLTLPGGPGCCWQSCCCIGANRGCWSPRCLWGTWAWTNCSSRSITSCGGRRWGTMSCGTLSGFRYSCWTKLERIRMKRERLGRDLVSKLLYFEGCCLKVSQGSCLEVYRIVGI